MAGTSWDHLNYKRFEHIEDSSEDEGDCHPNIDLGSWKRMKKRMRDEKGLPPRGVELWDAYNVTKTNKYKTDIDDEEPTGKQVEEFLKKSRSKLEAYQLMPDDAEADKFLQENQGIITESGKGFLITKAVDKSCEGEPASLMVPLMAKRCLTVHNIIEAAKDAKMPLNKAVELFFQRKGDKRIEEIYTREFNKQLEDLLRLIKNRTVERLQEAEERRKQEIKEMTVEEAEANRAPLGPGGLDPTEVLNELPKKMKDAFMAKDTAKLQEAISEMDPKEANIIMKKCVDSGLWVPGPDDDAGDETSAKGLCISKKIPL